LAFCVKDGVGVEYRYLDIIWLDNLLVNFIVVWITWKLSGNTAPMWRLWCSACVGAVYAVFLILPGFSLLAWFPVKVLLSLAMLIVGFRISSIKDFFKLFGFFYSITFLLGGAAFGFYYFFNAGIEVSTGIFLIRDFPVKIVIFSIVFIILLHRWLWPLLQFKLSRHQLIYQMEIWFGSDKLRIDSFLDTGNELTDPISGLPVMVVEFDSIRAVLPSEIQKIFEMSKEDCLDYVTQAMANSEWINRFRIVPYYTIGGHTENLLIAFKPDRALILADDKWTEIRDILIGIRNKKLSSNSEYQGLIQPQIIP
jgi:stage II sporulation protein GA (sporulation sigma-E factor processing peptidase)